MLRKQQLIQILAVYTSLLFAFATVENSAAASLETVRVLKIAGQDQRAVIKDSDGKTRIIKPGDSFEKDFKIVEIASGRIVIAEKQGKDVQKVIIRFESGKQTIELISKTGERQPTLFASAAPAHADK